MTGRSTTPNDVLARAERKLLRAAMGCVDAKGWAFEYQHQGVPVAKRPSGLRRLELAIANLRSVRKHNRRKRRG